MTRLRFYRDVGMRGWTGGADGTKTIVFEIDMPHCSRDKCTYDRPAVWALNAQVHAFGRPIFLAYLWLHGISEFCQMNLWPMCMGGNGPRDKDRGELFAQLALIHLSRSREATSSFMERI